MTLTLTTTTEAFLDKCGMNYTVEKTPAMQQMADGSTREVAGQFHLVRSSDQAVISPKTVSKKYVPVNPRDMISPIAPLIAEGWVTPSKGYMLSDGSHEMLSFKLDGGMLENKGTVVGEEWDHFFQLHNFQGAGSFFGTLYCKRLACVNGAVRVVTKSKGFRLRHMGAVLASYEEAMRTWEDIKVEIRKLSERLTVWNDKIVTPTEAIGIFENIFEVADTLPADRATRTVNRMNFAIGEFSNPRRATYGRSLYDIYNAITATNTHYVPAKSRETETKALSSLFNPGGSRNKLEARTVSILADLV